MKPILTLYIVVLVLTLAVAPIQTQIDMLTKIHVNENRNDYRK
jgi:hypothetical protein